MASAELSLSTWLLWLKSGSGALANSCPTDNCYARKVRENRARRRRIHKDHSASVLGGSRFIRAEGSAGRRITASRVHPSYVGAQQKSTGISLKYAQASIDSRQHAQS